METRITRTTIEPDAMIDVVDVTEVNVELQPRASYAVLYVCIDGQTKLRVRLEPGTKLRSNLEEGITIPLKRARKASGKGAKA